MHVWFIFFTCVLLEGTLIVFADFCDGIMKLMDR